MGCYAAIFAFYAANLGVNYESFEAVARANFDVRGHMMPDAPFSGFQKVTIDMNVKSDAPLEKLREIERLALAGCPGIERYASRCRSRPRSHSRRRDGRSAAPNGVAISSRILCRRPRAPLG